MIPESTAMTVMSDQIRRIQLGLLVGARVRTCSTDLSFNVAERPRLLYHSTDQATNSTKLPDVPSPDVPAKPD
jgi:hypothetical protein